MANILDILIWVAEATAGTIENLTNGGSGGPEPHGDWVNGGDR